MKQDRDFERILSVLAKHRVEYVVIGGLAGLSHGSAQVTFDLDVCYARDAENLSRLAAALRDLHASLRGAPAGLPFKLDARTLGNGLNFTFDTEAGPFDIFGEVAGVGTYEAAASDAVPGTIAKVSVKVLSLQKLIASKRAAGRPKDLIALQELEIILRARRNC